MNIIESIKNEINPELLEALANVNGETQEKTKLTLDTSITSILLAFMKRASTETGLHLLFDLTKSGQFGINQPINSIFPSEKLNKLADDGNALISKIIPDKKSPLITFVSSYSGVRNASANRTNGIVTLLILNKLKDVTLNKNLELNGLAELFADQKDYLLESAPQNLIERLSQHIGLSNLISLGSTIISTSATLSNKTEREKQKASENLNRNFGVEAEQTSGSGFNLKNWLIPGIFGLLILGLVGYYVYSEFYQTENTADDSPKDSLVNINAPIKIDSIKPQNLDSNAVSKSDTVVIEMEEQTLPNGQKIAIETTNIAYKILSFLNDTTLANTKSIVSTEVSFDNSGSEVANSQLENYTNIGKIMKAYPQSRLKVSVNDYTNNDSTFNYKRPNKRAFAIKKILMNNGIQPVRVDAVGKVNNGKATDALRAKEVELIIMKK